MRMVRLDNKIVVVFDPHLQCDLWIADRYPALDTVDTLA